jgi:hypothetical protein
VSILSFKLSSKYRYCKRSMGHNAGPTNRSTNRGAMCGTVVDDTFGRVTHMSVTHPGFDNDLGPVVVVAVCVGFASSGLNSIQRKKAKQ